MNAHVYSLVGTSMHNGFFFDFFFFLVPPRLSYVSTGRGPGGGTCALLRIGPAPGGVVKSSRNKKFRAGLEGLV